MDETNCFSDADEEVLGGQPFSNCAVSANSTFDGGFDSELLDRLQVWNADSLLGRFRAGMR
jgi:hypothetical protein